MESALTWLSLAADLHSLLVGLNFLATGVLRRWGRAPFFSSLSLSLSVSERGAASCVVVLRAVSSFFNKRHAIPVWWLPQREGSSSQALASRCS